MATVKNKVLIVWISTGDYNKRFDKFTRSLDKYLYSNDRIRLAIFSDNPRKYFQNIVDANRKSIMSSLSHYIYYHHIDHMPWPFVTCLKNQYLLSAIKATENTKWEPDYVCYCNSNIEFRSYMTLSQLCVYVNNKYNHKIAVCHNPAWWYEGCNPNMFTYGKPIDPKFKCAIQGHYEYLQAAFYIGPTKLIKEMSDSIMEMESYDLAHHRIAPFHDESYLNKWCYDNPDKINILPKEYLMDEDRKGLFRCPNPMIVMTNSDDTQYKYKDKYFE